MPTYRYLCKKCNHEFEELQSFTESTLVTCPNCHTDNLARVLGTGGGLIFKGSGFYLTDYKKPQADAAKATKKEAPKESESGAAPAKPDSAKPESPKTEAKPHKPKKSE